MFIQRQNLEIVILDFQGQEHKAARTHEVIYR